MSKNLLLIFIRNPELGKVKTRLAKTLGDEIALAIYQVLLRHTADITKKLTFDRAVYYSDTIVENDIWQEANYQKFEQEGENLGDRMLMAFTRGFEAGYEKVIIIGSDASDLRKQHIDKAIDALDTNDVVIGPAEDGGYYLFGMKELIAPVFQNKDWGSSTVRKDTLDDLGKKEVASLEILNDIDTYSDIKKNKAFRKTLKRELDINI